MAYVSFLVGATVFWSHAFNKKGEEGTELSEGDCEARKGDGAGEGDWALRGASAGEADGRENDEGGKREDEKLVEEAEDEETAMVVERDDELEKGGKMRRASEERVEEEEEEEEDKEDEEDVEVFLLDCSPSDLHTHVENGHWWGGARRCRSCLQLRQKLCTKMQLSSCARPLCECELLVTRSSMSTSAAGVDAGRRDASCEVSRGR